MLSLKTMHIILLLNILIKEWFWIFNPGKKVTSAEGIFNKYLILF
jgi:cbb3-type cytochrome oxidase subunit 3